MRILTVQQPWAWAIIHGGKDVENRVRNVAGDYRGPVAIHVGLRYHYDWRSAALDDAMRPVRNDFARRALAEYGQTVRHPWPWEESLGAIIGVVDLVDVHRHQIAGAGCGDSNARSDMRSTVCSPWAEPGAHHLVLSNPRPLAEPILYRGALGLRHLDDDTTARILAQIGGTDA